MRIEDLFQEDTQHGFVSSNLQELHDHCTSDTLTPFYPLMHHAHAEMHVGARLIVFPFTQNRTHCRVPAMHSLTSFGYLISDSLIIKAITKIPVSLHVLKQHR